MASENIYLELQRARALLQIAEAKIVFQSAVAEHEGWRRGFWTGAGAMAVPQIAIWLWSAF